MPALKSQKQTLDLLTLNLQVGIANTSLRNYLIRLWQHFLPSAGRMQNLANVGSVIRQYDLVALQEVDGGSFRSGFHNQTRTLSHHADHNYWHVQTNRDMGFWAQHSNALLSKVPLNLIADHPLPGLLPGRGAIEVSLELEGEPVTVIIAHLSLGRRARRKQLAFLAELIKDRKHVVLMGDLNASSYWLLNHSPLKDAGLTSGEKLNTYPSWKPKKDLDHILVSEDIEVHERQVMRLRCSDHLPIAVRIGLRKEPQLPAIRTSGNIQEAGRPGQGNSAGNRQASSSV